MSSPLQENIAVNHTDSEAVKALKEVALAGIEEQKVQRKWKNIFRIARFALFFLLIWSLSQIDIKGIDRKSTLSEYTAVVHLNGAIMSQGEANAEQIIDALNEAYADPKVKAVILEINSPGGSPVQSGMINDEMLRLRALHPTIPLYAVVTDICASGGYYIAVGAEKIFADKASLIGSIGVRMDSFGVEGLMSKLGVEARGITAGEHKALLSPFEPVDDTEKKHIEAMLENTFTQFKDVIKKGRGDRLKNDPRILSGLIWTGEQALELGMIDGISSTKTVARDFVKVSELVDFTQKKDFMERLGAQMSMTLKAVFETTSKKELSAEF